MHVLGSTYPVSLLLLRLRLLLLLQRWLFAAVAFLSRVPRDGAIYWFVVCVVQRRDRRSGFGQESRRSMAADSISNPSSRRTDAPRVRGRRVGFPTPFGRIFFPGYTSSRRSHRHLQNLRGNAR